MGTTRWMTPGLQRRRPSSRERCGARVGMPSFLLTVSHTQVDDHLLLAPSPSRPLPHPLYFPLRDPVSVVVASLCRRSEAPLVAPTLPCPTRHLCADIFFPP